MNLVNWNVEWATPSSGKGIEILRRVREHDPEVICLTEAPVNLMDRYDEPGHLIHSQRELGHAVKPERRKVMLWSKHPWRDVADVGSHELPPGRFVFGTTETSLGDVAVMGICIPWANSGANGPDAKRKRWEDHEKYLEILPQVIEWAPVRRMIVVGDFNHRIGQGGYTPVRLRSALAELFGGRLTIATAGLGFRGRRTIDHTALSGDLAAESLGVISNIHGKGELSDHFGVVAGIACGDHRH